MKLWRNSKYFQVPKILYLYFDHLFFIKESSPKIDRQKLRGTSLLPILGLTKIIEGSCVIFV